jgi:hypothetical protein
MHMDDDGGLAGAEGPAGVQAVGEADDGADGQEGRGALGGRQELGLQQHAWAGEKGCGVCEVNACAKGLLRETILM